MSGASQRVPLDLHVNGEAHTFQVRMHDSLLDVLRREGYTGAKRVCETADCGACSVLVDGRLIDACSTLALQVHASRVETIEGLAGAMLHPLQETFLRHAAAQCGYCTPGMILSMKALLERKPDASEAEIREVMTLCRCTGYVKPVAATLEYRDARGQKRPERERRE
ncbi:MAG: (2Fe-2S)-binding protein [Candidatus Latescibacterota bacterium]|nr:MAG: (2Fe-2S)-binding protein [Candidatus Latescibacterota bacterium]